MHLIALHVSLVKFGVLLTQPTMTLATHAFMHADNFSISNILCRKMQKDQYFLQPLIDDTVHLVSRGEGTGTRPDYLVNRDDQKNEGPFGGKKCTVFKK